MCGQLIPLKFSSTACEYCSRLGTLSPASVCSQNVAVTCAASAFGPSLVPTRKAMFAAPPPALMSPGVVDTCSLVLVVTFAVLPVSTLLGLLSMAWVMPVSPTPEVRNGVVWFRCCSGKSMVWFGWPTVNGVRLMFGIEGPPGVVVATPWIRIVVPCGMEAIRVTAAGSCGSVRGGMLIHTPGSICSPAGTPSTVTLASEICCRYVSPDMKICPWTRPRFGISPLMTSRSIWSLVTFSSRKWSDDPLCGRQMALKPRPLQFPTRPASGPRPTVAVIDGGAPSSLPSGWKTKPEASSMISPSARRGSPVSLRGPATLRRIHRQFCSPVITGCLVDDGSRVRTARQWSCNGNHLHLFGRPTERRADRGNRAGGRPALAGPEGRHGVEVGGDRVGGLFVVDPPADEILPRLGGVALDGEIDLAHPVDRAEEVLVAKADPAVGVGFVGHLEAHRLCDLIEAQEPGTQAQAGRYGRGGL